MCQYITQVICVNISHKSYVLIYHTSHMCQYITQVICVNISHKSYVSIYHTGRTCQYITQVIRVNISHKSYVSIYHTSHMCQYITQVIRVNISAQLAMRLSKTDRKRTVAPIPLLVFFLLNYMSEKQWYAYVIDYNMAWSVINEN